MSPSNPTIVNVLDGIDVKSVPIWLMRQAGRYLEEYRAVRKTSGSFLNLCYSPKMAKKVTLQPIERFNFDAAIIFSDILVIPDALGQSVQFQEGIGPVLEPLRDLSSLNCLKMDNVTNHLSPVYETISDVRSELTSDKAVIGFSGAPWTIATYMVEGGSSKDFSNIKQWAYSSPEEFSNLIEILISAITIHLLSQIKAGADVIQIFDSWAGMLPDSGFKKWCIYPIEKIVAGVKSVFPNIPIIIFPRLAGHRYIAIADIEGVTAVSVDHTLSTDWISKNLQNKVVVQGNLDPVFLLTGGAAMKDEVKRILEGLSDRPFIFNLGHGVLPNTPTDNVSELCEMVSVYRRS